VILIPILAVAVGILLGYVLRLGPVTGTEGVYLSVSCLAGLDTFFGGIRSAQESKFSTDVFVSGFVVNVLIAFFLAWLGDQIGQNLVMVAAIVFGMRIFTNLSLIRRYVVTKWQDQAARRKEQALAAQAAASTSSTPSNP